MSTDYIDTDKNRGAIETARLLYGNDREFFHFVIEVWTLATGNEGGVCKGKRRQWEAFVYACQLLYDELQQASTPLAIVDSITKLKKLKYVGPDKRCHSIIETL